MNTQQDDKKLLQSLVRQVRAESEAEMARVSEAQKEAEERGAPRAEAAREQLVKMGLSESDLEDSESKAEREEEIQRLSETLSQAGRPSAGFDADNLSLQFAAVPESVQLAPAVFSSTLSSASEQTDAQAAAPASDWYYNNLEHNPWAWAKGSGSGLAGTGVATTTIEVDFWYSFVPTNYRFYGINPYTTYRGYYIVKSDDSWYDSHYARVLLTNSVNVYQYNWKGLSHINVLDVRDDNINVNSRFDTTRNHYYSALLSANDRAWILNRVRLYVYARGGSAYAKLDFGTGAGNYITAPYVYVS